MAVMDHTFANTFSKLDVLRSLIQRSHLAKKVNAPPSLYNFNVQRFSLIQMVIGKTDINSLGQCCRSLLFEFGLIVKPLYTSWFH